MREIGQSQLVMVVVTIMSYGLCRKWNYEIVFVPVFSKDVFFIMLIWQNEILSFSTIFFLFKFLQIFKNMLYIHFIILLRECWLLLPTLLICNSQETPNQHSYCIIWQQHKKFPLTWSIYHERCHNNFIFCWSICPST